MLSFPLQTAIFIIHNPIDFRNGVEGLSAFCERVLEKDPLSGSVFVFRNKRLTSVKILFYDTQGMWLCQKRLSQGKFQEWPKGEEQFSSIQAHKLMVLLWNGHPHLAGFREGWKKVS